VALSGLRNAISTGDYRAICLLLWAGVMERIDIDILAWAVRHVGGNKIAILARLLSITYMSTKQEYEWRKALAAVRDEAEIELDQERIAFIDHVSTLRTSSSKSK
jgi:hypothetical protein